MGVSDRFHAAISNGWAHWRHGRRSYILALFGSCVVPFGIVYSGLWATAFISACWLAFMVNFVDFVVDGVAPAEESARSFVILLALLFIAHIVTPVIAVWMHNKWSARPT